MNIFQNTSALIALNRRKNTSFNVRREKKERKVDLYVEKGEKVTDDEGEYVEDLQFKKSVKGLG